MPESATPTWLFIDFDNTMMGTEVYALPSLIARFNELYGDRIAQPLTLETFKANWHGQAREILCRNMGDFYGIEVDCPQLYRDREWNMMRHYQSLPGGVPMAANLIATLTSLAKQDFRFAFVSNNPIQRALAAMRYAANGEGDALARLFGASFFEAGDVQKPKPDVYLRAMEQLRAAASDCFAIEDSDSGAKAAVAAGLTTFGYTGFSDEPARAAAMLAAMGCTATFSDWAELPALLKAA